MKKDVLAVIAAQGDVVVRARNVQSRSPRHPFRPPIRWIDLWQDRRWKWAVPVAKGARARRFPPVSGLQDVQDRLARPTCTTCKPDTKAPKLRSFFSLAIA
jgi:hypothetical protein